MPKMMAARSHHREITSSTGSALLTWGQATRSKLLLPCVSFSLVCRLKKRSSLQWATGSTAARRTWRRRFPNGVICFNRLECSNPLGPARVRQPVDGWGGRHRLGGCRCAVESPFLAVVCPQGSHSLMDCSSLTKLQIHRRNDQVIFFSCVELHAWCMWARFFP
jgi:hypothetical protein